MPWSSGANHTLALNDAMFDGSNGCGLCVKYRGTGTGLGTTPLSTTQWYTGFVNNRCAWRPHQYLNVLPCYRAAPCMEVASSQTPEVTGDVVASEPQHLHSEHKHACRYYLHPGTNRSVLTLSASSLPACRCPECAYGSLDINANGDGRWGLEWYATPCPVGDSTMRYDIVVSSYYWFSMVVSNTRSAASPCPRLAPGASVCCNRLRFAGDPRSCACLLLRVMFPCQAGDTAIPT